MAEASDPGAPTGLWLVGMMGSGKTTVGRAVARRAGVAFSDTDALVEKVAGRPIGHLWNAHGEEAFRRLEAEAVGRLARTPPGVVATGGGVVLADANVAAMRASGVVIWLRATARTLATRLGDDGRRPLLTGAADPEATLSDLIARRADRYRRAAHQVVDVDDLGVDAVTEEVMRRWIGS